MKNTFYQRFFLTVHLCMPHNTYPHVFICTFGGNSCRNCRFPHIPELKTSQKQCCLPKIQLPYPIFLWRKPLKIPTFLIQMSETKGRKNLTNNILDNVFQIISSQFYLVKIEMKLLILFEKLQFKYRITPIKQIYF